VERFTYEVILNNMADQGMNILKVLENGSYLPKLEMCCVDIYVFRHIKYSLIGTCKVDVDAMSIILVRSYEKRQVVSRFGNGVR